MIKLASVTILPFISLLLLSPGKDAPSPETYTPPVGIPAPSFGIDETHTMYEGKLYDYDGDGSPDAPYGDAGNGPYTHYIDINAANCSDADEFGSPLNPRCSFPNPIPAGAVVELHGQYDGDYVTISSQGTADAPAFLRGVLSEIPTIARLVTVQGSYLVIENILSAPTDSSDTVFGFYIPEGSHHIAIRNSEFSGVGNTNKAGGISVGSWSYAGIDTASNILLNDLNLHDLGDVNAVVDQDKHCITVNGSVNNLWLMNSEMARCSGDGIQIEARQGRRDKIHHIYVGNNISHDNKQSGMWIKHATDVIFSENTIYGHESSGSSSGQATGFQYGPEYTWFLFNKMYDNYRGIILGSNDPPGDGTETFIIGNKIYNNHNPVDPENPYNSGCITIRGGTNRYIINNTCYKYDYGISGLASSGKYIIYNNILSTRNEASAADVNLPFPSSLNSEMRNSLIYNTNGIKINWNGSNYTDLTSFTNATGEGQQCADFDPLFTDPDSGDFTFKTESQVQQVINYKHPAYDIFYERYGINLADQIAQQLHE